MYGKKKVVKRFTEFGKRRAVKPPVVNRTFKFGKRSIEELPDPPHGSRPVEYSDSEIRGFHLIKSYTKRVKFCLRYSYRRKRRFKTIGEFGVISVADARQIALRYKNLLTQGIDPAQELDNHSDSLTFKEFTEQIYLPAAKSSKNSWKDDQQKLEKDIYKAIGHKLLPDIYKRDIVKLLNAIQDRTSKSTRNRYRALLSSILNAAIDDGFLTQNCVRSIPKLAEPEEFGRPLTPDEVPALFKTLSTARNQVSASAVKLLLATGMRKSECLQLKWRNVDYAKKTVKLELHTTKGKRSRYVYLNPSAMAVITDLKSHKLAGNPYIFPSKNGKNLTTIRKTFETCKAKAGIENFRLHDCRHHFCSVLAGHVPQFVIQELVGHRTPAMTQRYSHLQSDTIRNASLIISDQLGLAAA